MKEPSLMGIADDRNLDGISDDPMYLDLLKRLGLG
jgi:hypothetical protein